jgi:hypothetical protein
MARISGLEKKQAPWHQRVLRGNAKDVRQGPGAGEAAMHVHGIVWGTIGMEARLSRKRRASLRLAFLSTNLVMASLA